MSANEKKFTTDYIKFAKDSGELRTVKVAYHYDGNDSKFYYVDFESLDAFYVWKREQHRSLTVNQLLIATEVEVAS